MRRMIGTVLLVLAVLLAACGAPAAAPAAAPEATKAPEATSAPAAEAVTTTKTTTESQVASSTTSTTQTTASDANLSGKLTIAGSSALLPMMQAAATQFQTKNPNVQITVTGGGSGAGRSQVCGGQIDIGDSDVKLSDKEKADFKCDTAVETPVAIQAFAPVANKQGPGKTTSLTKQQLIDIFTGKTTNWKDVGGDDQEIVLINRAKGSGTRSNMAKFLFAGDDKQFATGASEEDNSETVLQTVSQTPGAISYLGFAYLSNENIIAFGIDGVAPTKEDIQSGKWPIGGPGYAITKGEPNPLAKAFLAFVTSPEWQNGEAFSKLGFVPVSK